MIPDTIARGWFLDEFVSKMKSQEKVRKESPGKGVDMIDSLEEITTTTAFVLDTYDRIR